MLIVLFGIKPGVDAMRVASGQEQYEHSAFRRENEVEFIRGIELFAESIPGTLVQVTAALRVLQAG